MEESETEAFYIIEVKRPTCIVQYSQTLSPCLMNFDGMTGFHIKRYTFQPQHTNIPILYLTSYFIKFQQLWRTRYRTLRGSRIVYWLQKRERGFRESLWK